MSSLDPEWQRTTALRKVEQYRNELTYQGRPFTERKLAEFAATQVGATADQVLRWMAVAA